jgi:hypothetical protein
MRCRGDHTQYQSTVPPGLVNPVDIKAQGDSSCAVQAGHNTASSALKCWPIGASSASGAVSDSDNDGIADYYELHDRPFVTNPQRVDTDGDGVPDAIDPYPLDSTKTTNEQDASSHSFVIPVFSRHPCESRDPQKKDTMDSRIRGNDVRRAWHHHPLRVQ